MSAVYSWPHEPVFLFSYICGTLSDDCCSQFPPHRSQTGEGITYHISSPVLHTLFLVGPRLRRTTMGWDSWSPGWWRRLPLLHATCPKHDHVFCQKREGMRCHIRSPAQDGSWWHHTQHHCPVLFICVLDEVSKDLSITPILQNASYFLFFQPRLFPCLHSSYTTPCL